MLLGRGSFAVLLHELNRDRNLHMVIWMGGASTPTLFAALRQQQAAGEGYTPETVVHLTCMAKVYSVLALSPHQKGLFRTPSSRKIISVRVQPESRAFQGQTYKHNPITTHEEWE